MSILDSLLKALVWMTEMIIPFLLLWVLKELMIVSNGIRITLASRTLKQNITVFSVFALYPVSIDDVKKVNQDLRNDKLLGEKIPIKKLKESNFTF